MIRDDNAGNYYSFLPKRAPKVRNGTANGTVPVSASSNRSGSSTNGLIPTILGTRLSRDVLMSSALCGQWYILEVLSSHLVLYTGIVCRYTSLTEYVSSNDRRYVKACGAPDGAILPPEHVRATLEAIHRNCVSPYDAGRFGAVNGALPNGNMDTSSVQSEEFWTGSSYALAAAMLQEVRRDPIRTESWRFHTID